MLREDPTKIKEEIGKNLKARRESKGLSQEKLAANLGVSSPTIINWEHGKAAPRAHDLVWLCRYFQVSIDSFCAYQENLIEGQSVSWTMIRRPVDDDNGRDAKSLEIFRRIANGEHVDNYGPVEAQALRHAIYSDLVIIKSLKESDRASKLAEQLKDRFGLLEVKVAPIGKEVPDQFRLFAVGFAAKEYFLEHINESNIRAVGLSGGEMMRAMAKSIRPEEQLRPISLYPIHVCPNIEDVAVDANTLVGQLVAQHQDDGVTGMALQSPGLSMEKEYRNNSTAAHVLRKAENAETIFMGIGSLTAERHLYFADNMLADSLVKLGLSRDGLRSEGAVGNVAYHVITDKGKLAPSWETVEPRLCSISLDTLCAMADTPGCRVVVVAPGEGKSEVLRAAIEGKYVNALIVDVSLAEALLET